MEINFYCHKNDGLFCKKKKRKNYSCISLQNIGEREKRISKIYLKNGDLKNKNISTKIEKTHSNNKQILKMSLFSTGLFYEATTKQVPFFYQLTERKMNVPYSRFSEFFKTNEVNKQPWAENDIIVSFVFVCIDEHGLSDDLDLRETRKFCETYETVEHTTVDDIIAIIFKLMEKDGGVTKEMFEKKRESLIKKNSMFIQTNNPFCKFLDSLIAKFPDEIKDVKEFQIIVKETLPEEPIKFTVNPDVEATFRKIDKDESGIISKEEFKTYYYENDPIMKNNDALIDFIFAVIDEDGSGEIELNEFAVFATAYQANNIETEYGLLKAIFDMIDRDHSGDIDFEEMCAIMMRYYKINPLIDKEKAKEFKEELRNYMGKINQDNDPNISFEEFLRLFDVRYA